MDIGVKQTFIFLFLLFSYNIFLNEHQYLIMPYKRKYMKVIVS